MNTEINKSSTNSDEPPLPFKEEIPTQAEPKKATGGRPKKEDKESGVLQIKGVDQESRNVFKKACTRANKTAGEYFNTEVREFLQGVVKKSTQPPATEQDLAAIISASLDEKLKTIIDNQKPAATAEEIAEKVAQMMSEAKPESDKKGMFGRVIDAVRGV